MQPFLERDLLELTPAELDCFLAGVVHGYLEGAHNGYHQGRRDADQEAAVLQRRAAKIVHALARIDPQPRPHTTRQRSNGSDERPAT